MVIASLRRIVGRRCSRTAVVLARSRPLPTTLLTTRCQDSWHWFEGTVPAMFVLSRPGVVASCEARLHTSHGGRKYSFVPYQVSRITSQYHLIHLMYCTPVAAPGVSEERWLCVGSASDMFCAPNKPLSRFFRPTASPHQRLEVGGKWLPWLPPLVSWRPGPLWCE